jgi:flagellar hook-length control protein FliK
MAMSIDVSNLLSLFSSVSGTERLQLSEAVEAGSIEGFSEALTEQIALLQEQGQLPTDQQALTELQELIATKETGQLQEFAGLLNGYGKTKEPVNETGNELPLLSKLENNFNINDINIEETVETLQSVMQHITAVTDFVEEKTAEVTEVIEQAVAFLQGENTEEEHLNLQKKIGTPLLSTPLESTISNVEKPVESATNTLAKDVISDEDLALLTPVIQNHSDISNVLVEQKDIQQVFSKEFEKIASGNSVSNNPVASVTNSDGVVEVVTDTEQEFLDDMLNKEQGLFKPGQETSMLDKPKQAEFDLNALSATNSVEKPVTNNYAADISLLNRQMQSVGTDTKIQVPPMTQAFNHPEWQNEFSEKIVWMHSKSMQAAELRLNPQNLGPITIRIDVSQDQATIAFTAQHASVREAIEAAIPRLREMLSGQQINLAEVNVSQQDLSEQRHQQGLPQNGQKQNNQQENKFSMDGNQAENIENTLELTEEIERGRAVASNGILNIYA